MLIRLLGAMALFAATAAAEPVKTPACRDAAPAKSRLRTVRDVDWCNYDFGGWKGAMRAGRSSLHIYPDIGRPHDTIARSLRGVVYGDFNGDKTLDAGVIIEKDTWIGETGKHIDGGTTIHVYTLARGAPTRIGSISGGEPVVDVSIAKGLVVVTSGPTGSQTTERYRPTKDGFELLR